MKTKIGFVLLFAVCAAIIWLKIQAERQLRLENELLRQRIAQLEAQAESLSNSLAETGKVKRLSAEQFDELLRLRSEVTSLRADADSFTNNLARGLAVKIQTLKQRLDEMPDKNIPEIQFATGKDWVSAVWGEDLNTEDGVREALSKLREAAENNFLNVMMKAAFKKYLAAHNNILPDNLSQLKPYFDAPVSDDMLERYKLLQTGQPDNSADLVRLSAPYADEDYDSNHGMSINGAWGGRFNRVQQAVQAAVSTFAAYNGGQMPTDASQLAPYLERGIEPVVVQKYLDEMATGGN